MIKTINLRARGTTRSHWQKFYAEEFSKTGSEQAAHLAMWYQLLFLAFGD